VEKLIKPFLLRRRLSSETKFIKPRVFGHKSILLIEVSQKDAKKIDFCTRADTKLCFRDGFPLLKQVLVKVSVREIPLDHLERVIY